jgi:hypothetical protein
MKRTVTLLTVFVLVFVAGCPKKEKPGVSERQSDTKHTSEERPFATPEKTFATLVGAIKSKDLEALGACLAPGMIDHVLTESVFREVVRKAPPGKDAPQIDRTLVDLMARHGLTAQFIKALPKLDLNTSEEERDKARTAFLAAIKDKPALAAAVLTSTRAAKGLEQLANGKLKDVKITGEIAKATLVLPRTKTQTSNGQENQVPIAFKKVDGNWKLMRPEEKRDDSKETIARVGVKTLDRAVSEYKITNGKYPQTLAELTKGAGGKPASLTENELVDPWNQPYVYEPQTLNRKTKKPLIYSKGDPTSPIQIRNWVK